MSRARLLRTMAKVALLLIAVDWLVATVFFPRWVAERYVWPFKLIQDRTGSTNPGVVFEVMRRLPKDEVKLVFIGDSTMNPVFGGDTTKIAFIVGEQVQHDFPGRRVRPIDASQIGLFATGGLLDVAKAVRGGADVVVYGFTLRAFPRQRYGEWVSRLSDELSLGDLWAITEVGGLTWLRHNVGAEQALEGLVYSNWKAYAYRSELKHFLWERTLRAFLPESSALRNVFPSPLAERHVATSSPAPRTSRYELTRAKFGYPNEGWKALELIGRLCQQYLPGRCVAYAGPVNPKMWATLAEPGLYEEYMGRLHEWAKRHRVIWRDYTNVLSPGDFRVPKYGGTDPIHPNEMGRAKLAKLLVAPVAKAAARAIRSR